MCFRAGEDQALKKYLTLNILTAVTEWTPEKAIGTGSDRRVPGCHGLIYGRS